MLRVRSVSGHFAPVMPMGRTTNARLPKKLQTLLRPPLLLTIQLIFTRVAGKEVRGTVLDSLDAEF